MICFDIDPRLGERGIMEKAYVTAAGDLYCTSCGMEMDELEEGDYESYDYEYDDDQEEAHTPRY